MYLYVHRLNLLRFWTLCLVALSSSACVYGAKTYPLLDFNGDKNADIVWQNSVTGDRGFWLMQGPTYKSWVDLGVIPAEWHITAATDFDGDGKTDLLWENARTGDRGWWLMNGTQFSSWLDIGTVATEWHIAAAADMNSDGNIDIVWENTVTGERGIWLMDGQLFGSYVSLGIVPTEWRIAAVADFDGDGQPDILWENTATGDRGIWIMNRTAFSKWIGIGTVAPEWRIASAADFNQDGNADILWENILTGARYIWLMERTSYTASINLGTIPVQWQMRIPGAPPPIKLPVELIGDPGLIDQRQLTVSTDPSQGAYLWLKTHRLCWREDGEFATLENPRGTVRPGSKGSVRLNGGTWVPLTNATVTSEGTAAQLGGLNGSFMTVRIRLPLSSLGSPGLHAGTNTLEFRFDSTDGISSGWRVLGIDIRTSTNTSLLDNAVTWDDPDSWTAPLPSAADIAAGKALWSSASLTDLGFANSRHPILSKCASCHFADGYDLTYFNYSNQSIIARSKFHGLSDIQGEQIASYIRSIPLSLPDGYTNRDAGRPWNPPYQPGPGLDSKPVELWAAGAGIDAVLEEDADMRSYFFPGGAYSAKILGAEGFLNPRETPQALQYPDWNTWLPTAGPEDFVSDPTQLATGGPVALLKTATDWLDNYRWTKMPTDDWFNSMGRLYFQKFVQSRDTESFPGEYWYTNSQQANRTFALELQQARHNLARSAWFNVREFEFVHKYKLEASTERSGASGSPTVSVGYRSWGVPARTVFETAPHFQADGAGLDFNFTQPGNYLSTAWYSLEQVFNGGYHASSLGIDWNYHPFHIMGMHVSGVGFYSDGPIHAYRAAWAILWMYQSVPTMDWNQVPAVPWTPHSLGFSQRQLNQGLSMAFGMDLLESQGKITHADRAQIQEALALAFLGIAERYTPDQWVRRVSDDDAHRSSENFETTNYVAHYDSLNAYDLMERGYQADGYYLDIKQLKESGLITKPTLLRLIAWAKGVWPHGQWDLLNP